MFRLIDTNRIASRFIYLESRRGLRTRNRDIEERRAAIKDIVQRRDAAKADVMSPRGGQGGLEPRPSGGSRSSGTQRDPGDPPRKKWIVARPKYDTEHFEKKESWSQGLLVKKNLHAPKVSVEDVTIENQYDKLSDVVTPLHKLPYDQQLKIKQSQNRAVFERIQALLKENGVSMRAKVLPIKAATNVSEYRNKDEFSIWDGADGNPKTVGYFVGSPGKQAVCIPPTQLVNVKECHKLVAAAFQEFIRQSQYGVCKTFDPSDEGIYRNLVVRSNEVDQLQAVVRVHPKNLTIDQLTEEISRLRYFFGAGLGKECDLKSLYFQASKYAGNTAEKPNTYHMLGEEYIYSTLLGKKFRISPDSFFQVSASAAESLYGLLLQLAQPTLNTTLLDLCCGTGALSCIFAPHVSKTIGIDTVEHAIEDAQVNAKLNGVKNSYFMNGRVEHILPNIMSTFAADEVVAIVNPDRGGLHPSMINVLRESTNIKKLIYVSCFPEGNAIQNLVQLCMKEVPKKRVGPPFTIQFGYPVDMFPHTTHSELVILFQR